jgi:hypothetical protein
LQVDFLHNLTKNEFKIIIHTYEHMLIYNK